MFLTEKNKVSPIANILNTDRSQGSHIAEIELAPASQKLQDFSIDESHNNIDVTREENVDDDLDFGPRDPKMLT